VSPFRSCATTLAACALLCASLAAPAGATTISEFPLPVPQSSPLGITGGPDGNVWFTEVAGSRFGRVTPAGTVTDFSTGSGISANSRPWEITLGPDGRLYITGAFDHVDGQVRHNDFVLKFWQAPYEMTLFPDGRAIIKGTTDTAVARSWYARYVGS